MPKIHAYLIINYFRWGSIIRTLKIENKVFLLWLILLYEFLLFKKGKKHFQIFTRNIRKDICSCVRFFSRTLHYRIFVLRKILQNKFPADSHRTSSTDFRNGYRKKNDYFPSGINGKDIGNNELRERDHLLIF